MSQSTCTAGSLVVVGAGAAVPEAASRCCAWMRVTGKGAVLEPPYSTGMASAGIRARSRSVGTLEWTSTLAAVMGSMKAFTMGKTEAKMRGALKMTMLPTWTPQG
jgi:hypothetical protein